MSLTWFAVNSIKPEGQNYDLESPKEWEEALEEFGMQGQVDDDFKGTAWVLPQEGGCFVRGKISGTLRLLCSRCTDAVEMKIEHEFETFEAFPKEHAQKLHDLAPGKTHEKGRKREFSRLKHVEEAAKQDELSVADDADEEVMRMSPDGRGYEINIAALLWEELVLTLPIKTLCTANCAGLCTTCGANLNEGSCPCKKDALDPRLEALRSFKVKS